MAPQQKPGKSKQDYGTPPELLDAVRNRLGIGDFGMDMAATETNRVCEGWIDPETDSLAVDWSHFGWAWCNPPFAHIGPWVEKAKNEAKKGAHIAMLVPASVGANWWKEHVHGHAYVLFLNGRVTFVGETTPYPKDCVILLWTPFLVNGGGYDCWTWREA